MRVVYKYEVNFIGYDGSVQLPKGSKFLKFGIQQGNRLMAWFEQSNSYESDFKTFRVFATGELIDSDQYEYRGTVLATENGMEFVWHLYERAQS